MSARTAVATCNPGRSVRRERARGHGPRERPGGRAAPTLALQPRRDRDLRRASPRPPGRRAVGPRHATRRVAGGIGTHPAARPVGGSGLHLVRCRHRRTPVRLQQDASWGGLHAELSYLQTTQRASYVLDGKTRWFTITEDTDFRVRLERAERELLDRALDCDDCQPAGLEAPHPEPSIHFDRLRAGPEPALLVDLYTGGAHCRFLTDLVLTAARGSECFASSGATRATAWSTSITTASSSSSAPRSLRPPVHRRRGVPAPDPDPPARRLAPRRRDACLPDRGRGGRGGCLGSLPSHAHEPGARRARHPRRLGGRRGAARPLTGGAERPPGGPGRGGHHTRSPASRLGPPAASRSRRCSASSRVSATSRTRRAHSRVSR